MTSLATAHGKLWYDDPWYRTAWLVLPQAAALLVIGWAWLARPATGDLPWAKPNDQTEKRPAERRQEPAERKPNEAPPLAQQDPLEPCRGGDNWSAVVQACSLLLSSASTAPGVMPDAYFLRAWAYRQVNQPQLALSDYDHAIALSPNDYRFLNDRGRLWRDVLRNNDKAYEDFTRTIAAKPDFAEAYASRGWLLLNANRYNDALVDMNSALARDPNNTAAYEGRANVFEHLKSWRLMSDDANKMIELMPDNRIGYEYRGHAFFENGQYTQAIADFTKAIALAPQEIYSYRLRGRSYYFLGDYDKAALDYGTALRIVPNDSDTLGYMKDMQRRRR